MSILNYFQRGKSNTLIIKNNGGFTHSGPWASLSDSVVVDRWYLGDFISVDYTISVDLDANNKEMVKFMVTATMNDANMVEYARSTTGTQLITLNAQVNNSYVNIIASPAIPLAKGAKYIFSTERYTGASIL